MQEPILLGIVLLTAGGAALACALYTVRGNYRPQINREFLAAAGSLVAWNFGLALFGAGANAGIRCIGAYVSDVGYMLTAFFLLRYLLLLTGRRALLEKRFIRALLYLPFPVLVCGLVFRPGGMTWSYSRWGWIETSRPALREIFFACHYVVFLAAAGLLLLRWVRRSPAIRGQSGWLMGSLVLAAVAGGVPDILFPLLRVPCPRVAAVFWAIPIFAAGYSVRRFNLIQDADDGRCIILTERSRYEIYRLFARYLILGGLANLLFQKVIFIEKEVARAFLFSAVLIGIGVLMLLLDRFRRGRIPQEFLLAVMATLLIPVIMLHFYVYGGITVWALIFPLMVVSLLFNRRVLLVTAIACAFQAQLFLWGIAPHAAATVDMTDYLTRIFLIFAMSSVCIFANGIYLSRLRENAMHSAGQLLVSEISRSFLAANEENIEEKTEDMLRRAGSFIQCAQAYIALLDADRQIRFSCEWLAAGAVPARDRLDADIQKLCRVMQTPSNSGHPVIFLHLKDILPEAEFLLHSPDRSGAHRLVCLPVQKKEDIVGLLLFVGVSPAKLWKNFVFLSIISNIVADTVNRIDSMRTIRITAYHDHLTGLPNRVLFKRQLKQALANARREGRMLSVVFIDLDAFKVVNDTLGHETGDRVLKGVAGVLLGQARSGDVVCRFGGDEFVLLLEQVPHIDGLLHRLETILDALRQPIRVDGQEMRMMGSAGVSVFPQDGEDAETLIKHADLAMYHAKGMGKNRYALCSNEMKAEVARQGEMIHLLYRAQEKEQLLLYYQPQVSLKTRRMVGVEALMRWDLPGRGFIQPGVFIPLAEQTGLIHSIGEWALLTACRQAARWRAMGLPPLRMAVNISVQQLASPHFSQRVADILQKTGLPPRYLELEVTESVAYRDIGDFPMRLNQLKQLGVSISIDDFGTGFSSFGRIKLLPVDRIKLDTQFVRGIETSAYDRAVAGAVIDMAKGLEMKVIAEGLETTAQLDFLDRRMCDEVQGYFYFRPVPAARIETILQENRPLCPAGWGPPDSGVGTE